MHEWLSGGASPCQGEGRGFESRLVLFLLPKFLVLPRDFGFFCATKNYEIIKCFFENCDIIRRKETL